MTYVKKRRLSFIILLVCITASLQGFDLAVNNGRPVEITPQALRSLSYPVPDTDRYVAAVSLLEALPLFNDVYRITIEYAGGETMLESDNFAHMFRDWFFIIRPEAIDLRADGTKYRDIKSFHVNGELLPSDELSIWIGWEGLPQLKEELVRFAGIHDLTLNILEVPAIDSKLTAAARSGGKLPDLVMLQSDFLPALTEGRILQRLDYIPLPGVLEKGKNAFTRNGGLWGVPFYFDTQLLFYNPELIPGKDAGFFAGWNLDDFETLCEELKGKNISPATWNAYSAYWLIPFQLGFGKRSILEPDGGIIIDDAPTRKAIEYLLYLQEKGYLDIRERDGMISRFLNGDVAMVLSGSYSITEFENLGIPFETAAYPYNPESDKSIAPLLDFKAFGITRKTKNPVLARRFIEYLTGIGVQQRFPSEVSKLPALESAWEIMALKNDYYKVLKESYDIGAVIPPEDSYKIFKNTMWKLLRFAITGELSVEETLKQGQTIIDNKLDQRR